METLNKKKAYLVEKLGVFLERKEGLAPIAARILAQVILTGKQGTTFEDLVSTLCASKSTISTHLNHLYDLKRLDYFTKTGDRKKYYTINVESMVQNITDMLEEWKSEKELHIEMMEFKAEMNKNLSEENKFELHFHESYIEFNEEAIKSIAKLKETIVKS
ncbi:MAG: transcriptional regulator [Aequorivita sp.]|nr:transcriptional regulator [Aequorivita sp.]MCB0454445.1 transcriptional regulator [Aequorivita sp.]MCB0467574.1 transcriptional regulator [Aequorivita sp.]HPE83291.1 transcriptional regulator [Aequorivita sp.]